MYDVMYMYPCVPCMGYMLLGFYICCVWLLPLCYSTIMVTMADLGLGLIIMTMMYLYAQLCTLS